MIFILPFSFFIQILLLYDNMNNLEVQHILEYVTMIQNYFAQNEIGASMMTMSQNLSIKLGSLTDWAMKSCYAEANRP